MKKKTHTEELITEPFIIDNPETVAKLLDVLEGPCHTTNTSKYKLLTREEAHKFFEEKIK